MKKIIFSIFLIFFFVNSYSQIYDTTKLRDSINIHLVPNNTNSITAIKLNRIIGGLLNTRRTIWDSLNLKLNRLQVKQLFDSFYSASSSTITGTGLSNRLSVWGGTSSQTSFSDLTYDDINLRLKLGSALVTIPNGTGSLINSNFSINTLSQSSSIGLQVLDGINNRKAGLFVDNTNSLWGLSSSQSSNPTPFTLRLNGLERFRIDTDGNFIIGTTVNNGINKLQVAGSGRFTTNLEAQSYTVGLWNTLTYTGGQLNIGGITPGQWGSVATFSGGTIRSLLNSTGLTLGTISGIGTGTLYGGNINITNGILAQRARLTSIFLNKDSIPISNKLNAVFLDTINGQLTRTNLSKIHTGTFSFNIVTRILTSSNLDGTISNIEIPRTHTPFSLENGYGLIGSNFDGSISRTFIIDTSLIATKLFVSNSLNTKLQFSDTGRSNQKIATAYQLNKVKDSITSIFSYGVYTPSYNSSTNISTYVLKQCNYYRIGDIVNVSGWITLNTLSNEELTQIRLTIPLPSTFSSILDISGNGIYHPPSFQPIPIKCEAFTSNIVNLTFLPYFGSGSNIDTQFSFTYKIL